MKLGKEVGLSPGHIVLDEDPAVPKRDTNSQFSAHIYCGQKRGTVPPPIFMPVVAKRLDGSRCHLVRGTAPNLRPMSIVAKRSPISATAEH